MNDDEHADIRNTENLHYPFASKSEFDLACWLSGGALSQKEIDGFLHLEHTKNSPPSFNTAKDLQAWIEGLPEVPRWYHQQIKVGSYKMKAPLWLYWRDGLDIVKHLFANPVFTPCMDFRPCQDKLPPGHSFVGVIGASDKTPLMIGTGNKEMHPLLISLANIHVGVHMHMKATSHAFALVAYLPIPRFLEVSRPIHSILSVRVYHFVISIVMRNLKMALLIACTALKCSPISLAVSTQFGDPLPHSPRIRSRTLDAIERACTISDPCEIASFYKACQSLHLNGVVEPYWMDWGDACPSRFLMPDALHQWHKFFFDHPITWSINIMGGAELDWRLSVLQPRVGVRHWANGVSTLKQLSGRDHRDLKKLLPAMIIEFIFQAQNLFLYDKMLHSLTEALRKFHHYKVAIITAGGCRGKNGPLNHFQIPKLELMQHVVRSTRAMGAPYQWSSDITEHCHITHVKRPYRMTNHKDFHGQCCRFLNRQEKLQFFQLYTMSREANAMALHYPEATWISTVLPDEQYVGAGKPIISLFTKDHSHISSDDSVAILLTIHPHHPHLSIEEVRFCRPNCSLSFDRLRVWLNFRMQRRSTQDSRVVSPAQTIQALPPSSLMPFGRGNTVLVAHESGELLSLAASECYAIIQVKFIFQPITEAPHLNQPFLYVEFFNFSQSLFNTSDDDSYLPLESVRQVIQLIPKFGQQVSASMNCDNILQLGREYYVNNFADKETFHAILSYQ
ncbi:hypothetical protein EV702DRAFT_1181125 [Suillus placidus]|uniref:DUF6830 domain-containing protein n=1 Tax=Suillus placidus TaxID=48579 RepID=A0A9P6ZP69_9AGAM|nr:hypothetical protein EV702DRAFT_1181125 [Suillus placidus]